MNTTAFALSLLLPAAALCAALPAAAAAPAGQIVQLSGFAMALKPGGGMKVLGSQSALEVGETLSTEQDSYARLKLADSSDVILGPNTRVVIQSPTSLLLTSGRLQVTPGPMAGTRLTVEAGGTTVDASKGSVTIGYVIDPQATLAQRAYARASMASAASTVRSDADATAPVWEATVAQATSPRPPTSAPGNLAPGLHVFVSDGQIVMSNRGGAQQFAAGQFGYTATPIQAPALVPRNPGLQFTLPASFNAPPPVSGSSSAPRSNAVDCEVR